MLFSPENLKTKIIQNEFRNFFLLSSFLASVVLAGFSVLSPAFAATGINEQISFQGKVVNSDGTNVTNGSYTFLFCLYTTGSPVTACTGGANNDAVWRESKSVTVTDGIFQTNLGDTTTLPGSVDFNTDNIYLGINFNGDGQMTPLVRFTAAPYALNAAKVGGLTVTDTTGTLTIPNGKTISFAESFTTSGAFATTLTSTGVTNVTLPTTGTLTTLAGVEVLTNKTIGSTGLIFSGAVTDITTASGEDWTVVANGAGIINLNDAVTVSGTITFSGFTTNGGLLYTNGSGVLAQTAAGTTSGVLHGGITPTYGDVVLGTETSGNYVLTGASGNGVALTGGGSEGATLTAALGALTADWNQSGAFDVTLNNAGSELKILESAGDAFYGIFEVGNLTADRTYTFPDVDGTVLLSGGTLLNTVGDSGSSTLIQGDTLTLSGGTNGIDTVLSGDTYTFNLDTTEIGTTTFGSGSSFTWTFNPGDWGITTFQGSNQANRGTALVFSSGSATGGCCGNGTGASISMSGGEASGPAGAVTITAGDGNNGYAGGNVTINGGTYTFSGGYGNVLLATSYGNVGVGDTSPTSLFTVGSGDLFEVNSSGAIVDVRGITNTGAISSTGAIAANGGITFDAGSDTVGAFTAAGTILMGTNILENIGNTGTDFIATTGALTLAGVLTGNGGVTTTTLEATGDVTLNDGGADTILIGQSGATDDTVTIAGDISFTDDNWSVAATGVASFITGSSIGSLTFTTNNIADSGALTIKSATTNTLTLDSGTTGTVNIATGTAGKAINIGTDNTTSDTISIGSALDNVAITGDQWSITNAGVLTVVSCSGCGGGGATLDSAYTAGNAIGTDSGSNVIINLADVATPTEVTINNLDASGTNALQIDNSTTLTNALFVEQSAAGTLTNALHVAGSAGTITNGLLIADGVGAITNGIQLTGTFTTTILDTPSLDISGAGAITGAQSVSVVSMGSYSGDGAVTVTAASGSNLTVGSAVSDIGGNSGALILNTGDTAVSGTAGNISMDVGASITGNGSILVGTAVRAQTITIGNASDDTFSINSSGFNVTSSGALTGVASIDTIATSATALTFAGAGTISTTTISALTLDSGTTGIVNLGTGNNAKTINIATGTAGNTVNIGTNNTTSDTINIGSALDNVAITGDQWSITNAGVLTVASCSGCGGGGSVWSSISVPTGNLALAMDADTTTFNWDTITTQTGFTFGSAATATTTYDLVKINHTGSMADTTAISGNLLDISRALTIDAGGIRAITVSSPVVTISDTCVTGLSDTCTHSGNVLALAQNFATSTGSVLSLTDAGTGNGADILLTNTAGTQTNGLFINRNGAGGTTTNALHIGNTAGTLTTAILIDGTSPGSFILDTGSIDISGAGAITGATGVSTTTLTSSGATDLANVGASNVTIATTGTGTVAIGNSTGTFALTSSGGLNVSTGGALTGVASIDTIAVSATALTFAGTGTLASTTTGLTLDSGSNTLTVAASDTTITASGVTTLTLGSNTVIASAGTITLDAASTTIIPDADTFQTNDVTSAGALTLTAGSTAQNITLTPTTTGYVTVTSSTGTSDTIRLLPATGAAAFAGIITTADLTVSDKTYTFPNANITVNAAADISGTTLASNVTGSSLTSVGTLGLLTVSGAIAANGGITFDATSDTIGSYTAGGTILMNSNILQDIGNTGTDFVASTGALTLAGVLTANGGVSLAGSQSFTASALAYMDFGSIVHNTTANQGLRLPNAASASPSSPTSGEGYIAWDAGGNQIIVYNGSAWATLSGGSGYNLIKDEVSGLTARTTLAFLGAGVSCADNATQTECTISGGGSSTLADAYNTGAAGDQTITLDATQDSIIVSNPAASGTDSTFTFKVEQLNTGIANDAIYIGNRGTGNGLRIDDASGDTTPFIVDASGKVGIGTSSVSSSAGTNVALQVGSATNRGNASFYGDVTAEGYDIQRSLTGIIDIFVYDTTRDADGGEWRKSALSQQLSWYTETTDNTGPDCVIGTDDRCGKSEFPRKAILVTTASALYIFDGADNTLWMSFTQVGTYAMGADTNNNPSGVGAQNGVVVVGTNGTSATGMYAFDFKQDTMFRYNATNRVQGDKNIGNRNSAVTYATDANTSMAIADAVVNDVSIAMQTSSSEGMINTLTLPLDSAGGPSRGVTLIAAATNTAVSVVNMAARKTLNYSDVTNDDYYQVVMTTRGRLYATNFTQSQLEEWKNIDRDLVSEANGTPDRTYDETTPNGAAGKTPITTGTTPTFSASNPGQLAVIERASSARESAATTLLESGDIVFVGSNQGLAEVHTSGGNLAGASWSKITTTTVATPYMVGAPRGVFTFDDAAGATSTSSVVGTTGSTRQVLDQAGATAPTFGGGGVRGTSVNFNNNSYLCSDANADGTCDADTDFNAGTIGFTVSLWFKHSVTAAADALFERCYTPATPTAAVGCVYAGMTASGTIRFAIDSLTTWTYDTTYDDTIVSTAAYNDNQWHHAVFTNTDTDICMYIDGKQAVACDSTIAATATMDASQVLTVGGVCSGANCTTGTNFWDGSIDDFVWSSNGATTDNGLPSQGALKLYLDGRAHLIRPSSTVTNATAFSSTTIGDSGEAYTPGSFAGLVVELTGGTGSGQTRMIVSNDATTFTVSPAWSTTPDATTDYQVSPAKLYGASNNVTAIAPDLPTNLNRLRKVYVGTSDGSDGGGVTIYTNAGTGSLKTQVIHSDAGYSNDDLGSSWSGTDADDISALSAYSDTVAMGNGVFMRAQRADIGLKQLQLDVGSAIEDIRQELVSKQLYGSTQDVLGLGQGADLAERYYSDDQLQAGEIVSLDASREAGIRRSKSKYQKDVIGVVATKPGLILGSEEEDAYPVALVGRVPVKVINENGQIYAGDRITASSRPGYGMFASQAGRVLGTALSDASDWTPCDGTDPNAVGVPMCTSVLVFVNLTDYFGQSVELAMAKRDANLGADGLSSAATIDGTEQGISSDAASIRLASNVLTKQEKILEFLKEVRDKQNAEAVSEVFTGRVSASTEVITPTLYADQIFTKSIKADSIEGLQIFTDQISSLAEKYAGLEAISTTEGLSSETTSTVQKQLAVAMKKLSLDTLAVQMDGSILGKLSVNGALRIGGDAEFSGNTLFAKLASFLGDTLFKGNVMFERTPTFGNDTAGFAVIEKGEKKVHIAFDTPYEKQPIVAVTLTNERSPLLDGKEDEALKADVAQVEKDYLDSVFDADIKYIVTDKSADGFTIVLNKKATETLQFSWVALSVKKAKSFNSEKEKVEEAKESAPVEETPAGVEPVPTNTETEPIVIVPDSTPEISSSETASATPSMEVTESIAP